MATGTLNIADLQERLPALFHSKMVLVALAFFTVGISLKLALFPLHAWLPGAYTHAPSVVSCIMAATATKVGVYAMLRIIFGVFKIEFDIHFIPIANILIVVSSMAIIAGSALAIAQTNLKRMLAYSSIGQIGYIVLGAVLANQFSNDRKYYPYTESCIDERRIVYGCRLYCLQDGYRRYFRIKGDGQENAVHNGRLYHCRTFYDGRPSYSRLCQ